MSQYQTGWGLLTLVAILAALSLRKRLAFLPLGSMSVWKRTHVWLGLIGFYLLARHAGSSIPNGALDLALWLLFLAVALGGVLGNLMQRRNATLLAREPEELIFERIPALRHALACRAEEAVRAACADGATTLAEFHQSLVAPYLSRAVEPIAQLLRRESQAGEILDALKQRARHFDGREREAAAELASIVQRKNSLDRQRALQGANRYWLFLHIGLTAALLLVAGAHAFISLQFRWDR